MLRVVVLQNCFTTLYCGTNLLAGEPPITVAVRTSCGAVWCSRGFSGFELGDGGWGAGEAEPKKPQRKTWDEIRAQNAAAQAKR